jgi:PAS domain S-box-containing protein
MDAGLDALREGEQRYRLLMDLLPVAVYSCEAPSGVITFFNEHAAALWGRTPQLGETDERFCGSFRLRRPDGSVLPYEETPMARALSEGRAFRNEEVTIEQPDGTCITMRVHIDPLRDADGRVTGTINVFQDATALKRTEGELRDSERRFRDMIDALPAAVYTTDAEGRLTHFNPAAVEFSGRVPVLGTDRWSVSWRMYRSDGSPLPHAECPMAIALREGRPIHGEEAISERPDGSRVWFAAYPRPFLDADNRVVGGINMLVDVTDRKHAEQAQAHLAAIVESSDDAIVGKNLDGIITSWNSGAERIFGYSAAEAAGRSITIIIPPERLSEEATILERIRRGERVHHYETVRRRRDGTLLDISITVSPITDAQGRVIGASKIARDITAQKLAEKARVEEALVRETLARVGATLTAQLDEQKVVQAITDAGTAMTSADCGAFFQRIAGDAGESFRLYTTSGPQPEAFVGFPQPEAAGMFEMAFRGEATVCVSDVTMHLNGSRNTPDSRRLRAGVSVRSYLGVPVRSRAGESLGALFFGHSQPGHFLPRHEQLMVGIASSAAVALDNARLYKQAQDANRAKDEFLATLSHELRTPLNAILGWSQMLRSAILPAETQRRALESVERNAKAQAQLVEDLLDVSRIVSGKLQIKSNEVDLARVVADAVDSVRPAASAKGLILEFALRQDTGILVKGDADRLRQVVWNLLSNAIKFTPSGGQVVVELKVAGSNVELIVRDTGEGIPRDFLRHVFERFRQAESTISRRHGGLGLGLAIVRHLIEAHGGTVAADSAGEGRGATFTVSLPLCAGETGTKTMPHARTTETPVLAGISVLVVDDQADARDLARVVLELHGADVTTVASAGEALHALAERSFAVLLADIGMPEQDGYSLIQSIRALAPERGGTISAIAATAYASIRERTMALDAGYDWHLAKPLDPEQLVATVLAASHRAEPRQAP